jgi:hypothetical protein
VGEIIAIPVFLFSTQSLKSYHVQAALESVALLPVGCLPGDFPRGQCEPLADTFELSGDFPESQRTGRIHIGTLRARVRLNALSRIRVTVLQMTGVPETTSTAYEFSVMLGEEETLTHPPLQNVLNRVISPASTVPWLAATLLLPEEDTPTTLVLCCDTTVAKPAAGLGKRFSTSFAFSRMGVRWGAAQSPLGIMDPRLRVVYDRTLLAFSPDDGTGGRWEVLDGGRWSTTDYTTTIEVTYYQPDSRDEVWQQEDVTLTLAEVDRLVLSPDQPLALSRVHCAPTVFQQASVVPSLVLKNGLGVLPLDETDVQFWVEANPRLVILASLIYPSRHTSIQITGLKPGISSIEVGFGPATTQLQVAVLDDSVLLSQLEFPAPLELRACKDTPTPIPVTARLPDGTLVQDLHRFGAVISNLSGAIVSSSQTWSNLDVNVLGNSLWGDPGASVTVALPGCHASPEISQTFAFTVKLLPCLTPSQIADVEVTQFEDRAELTLVGQGVLAFYVQVRVQKNNMNASESPFSCTLTTLDPSTSDCTLLLSDATSWDWADVIIAGTTPLSSSNRHPLATLRPRPEELWGFVEVSTDVSPAIRSPIVSGRMGLPLVTPHPFDPIQTLMPNLPVVDTDTLARRFSIDTLYLMTNRRRIVETSIYSNNRELSIMFRVTDRFLVPDSTTTRITCTIRDPSRSLPLLPGAQVSTDQAGTQTVLATPIADGWYAVQSDDSPTARPIPKLGITLDVSVETPLSPNAWTIPLPRRAFETGTTLYACPRSATDQAIFVAEFRVELAWPPTQQLIRKIGCQVHVAARRISFTPDPDTSGNYTLSILVESFIRLRQVREAFSDPSWFLALASADRPHRNTPAESLRAWAAGKKKRTLALPDSPGTVSLVKPDSLVYVNDTADDPDAQAFCPPGKYFSANGTYEPLPQHSQSGPDCYGLVCVEGYELAIGQPEDSLPPSCIPSPVPDEVIWVCIIVILSLVVFVVSIICCVRLSRGIHPAGQAPLPAPQPPPATDASLAPPPHDWGIMALSDVRLDDYSTMILDGEFSPKAHGGRDPHCRVY